LDGFALNARLKKRKKKIGKKKKDFSCFPLKFGKKKKDFSCFPLKFGKKKKDFSCFQNKIRKKKYKLDCDWKLRHLVIKQL